MYTFDRNTWQTILENNNRVSIMYTGVVCCWIIKKQYKSKLVFCHAIA